ncbi:MAG: hypothetical protein M1836_005948 [Candelina mexicana]|nr:MAG: hypothetical protein M1836_005948 [Candelina mexicana]
MPPKSKAPNPSTLKGRKRGPGILTDDQTTSTPKLAKKTKVGAGGGRTIETPKAPFAGVYPALSLKDQPEWGGYHGRLIVLLPQQNRFVVPQSPGFTIEEPPDKPVEPLIEASRYTKFMVGIATDTVERKVWKKGGTMVQAGQDVYIRINPDSATKNHDLISTDGSHISSSHVLWITGWESSSERDDKAKQMIRKFKSEQKSLKEEYDEEMDRWKKHRKAWELKLVMKVWDEKLAKFPPYVTSREQLGDKIIYIPEEYANGVKPEWKAPNLCDGCMKRLPEYCGTCEKKKEVYDPNRMHYEMSDTDPEEETISEDEGAMVKRQETPPSNRNADHDNDNGSDREEEVIKPEPGDNDGISEQDELVAGGDAEAEFHLGEDEEMVEVGAEKRSKTANIQRFSY